MIHGLPSIPITEEEKTKQNSIRPIEPGLFLKILKDSTSGGPIHKKRIYRGNEQITQEQP